MTAVSNVDTEASNDMTRTGACLPNCGACCESIVLQIAPDYTANPDIRTWIELHGLDIYEADGGSWLRLATPCTALQPDKSCGVYGTPLRPQMCADWPQIPRQLQGLEAVCGFSFEGV
jgi:Fe-S-cluster containining protein